MKRGEGIQTPANRNAQPDRPARNRPAGSTDPAPKNSPRSGHRRSRRGHDSKPPVRGPRRVRQGAGQTPRNTASNHKVDKPIHISRSVCSDQPVARTRSRKSTHNARSPLSAIHPHEGAQAMIIHTGPGTGTGDASGWPRSSCSLVAGGAVRRSRVMGDLG